jgi:predicted nuclease with RNAse H fold
MSTAIGIDPASGKETCIWQRSDFVFVKAQNVRPTVAALLNKHPNCVIAWDAPVSFGRNSFSDRRVDKVTRAWIKEKVAQGRLEKSAVNALPFSGLSHWVISCEALGSPFGKKLNGLSLYPNKQFNGENGQHLVEVHPAVAMACLWLDNDIESTFPVYKKSQESRKAIVEALSFPEACIESDDILDSYVAYLMAELFVNGNSVSVCDPAEGSYVLPKGASTHELSSRMG